VRPEAEPAPTSTGVERAAPAQRNALTVARAPEPPVAVRHGEPMIGYLATPSLTWSEEHERSHAASMAAADRSCSSLHVSEGVAR